jgi:hypothetical protein
VILPIEKQVHHGELTQVAASPCLEILIQLLRDAAHRALAQPAAAERVPVERTDILRRQPADIHAAHQTLEIGRAGTQSLGDKRVKRFLGPAQLRHRQLQQAGLTLDLLRFVAVAPPHALPRAAPIVLTTEKGSRLRFDRHLQHVAGEPADESHHRRFTPLRPLVAALQHAVDVFLHLNARWYSLHGVDLLRPRANGAVSGLSYQEDTNASCFYRKSRTSPIRKLSRSRRFRRCSRLLIHRGALCV